MSDITQTQYNSILTISQLNELIDTNLVAELENQYTIFDSRSNNQSVMEISYTQDTSDPKKYMSRKIKTTTLAKGINDVLIRNTGLMRNNELINITDLENKVNNIISSDQEFIGNKIFKDNIYKETKDDDNQNKYVTSSEVKIALDSSMQLFSNSQYINNNISNLITNNNDVNGNLSTVAFSGNPDDQIQTADNTGQLVIIGYVNADNSSIDSQFLYTALEIKTSNGLYAVVSIQPYVIPMNGNSLQYFSFNIPIAKGTEFRVRPNFELNDQYGGVPVNPQNLTFTKNNNLVVNGYRWYII